MTRSELFSYYLCGQQGVAPLHGMEAQTTSASSGELNSIYPTPLPVPANTRDSRKIAFFRVNEESG